VAIGSRERVKTGLTSKVLMRRYQRESEGVARREPLRQLSDWKEERSSVAERVGFEPTCRLPDKTLSRRPRYDHFGTSPVVLQGGLKTALYVLSRHGRDANI
jgi:hypothetical protein